MTDIETRTDDYRLNADELAQFERNGYFGPFTLYQPDEMEERWRGIQRALLDRSKAPYHQEGADSRAIGILNHDRHLDVDLLSEHIVNPKIVDRMISILGPDVICWRSEFFPKQAGDEGTDWHQVANFANGMGEPLIEWPAELEGTRFGGSLTAWTAFTDATVDTACLQVIPGTHNTMHYDESTHMKFDAARINAIEKGGVKRGLYGYDYRDMQVDPDWAPDESKAVSLEMCRGEAVILWSTVMHASLPHTGSKRNYRMGYSTRYLPPFVKVYPGRPTLNEHGNEVSLDRHRCVLVAGEDRYGVNRLTADNYRGFPFTPRRAKG